MRMAPLLGMLFLLAGCANAGDDEGAAPSESAANAESESTTQPEPIGLPPSGDEAMARLEESPRHGEWVMIQTGAQDSIRAWVVYPERSDPAPVVLVVHEIFGLSHWVRAVADQFAAEGYIAIAPDLLTMRNIPPGDDGAPSADVSREEIRTLDPDDIHRQLLAVADYGMSLPSAQSRYGVVGFCWGGGTSFEHAVRSPELAASVVYYGTPPDSADLAAIQAPVLGLYGGNDNRVSSTVPATDAAMEALGKVYEPVVFEGAGHGFLRAQDGQDGANLAAARAAWPRTIEWFRQYLGA